MRITFRFFSWYQNQLSAIKFDYINPQQLCYLFAVQQLFITFFRQQKRRVLHIQKPKRVQLTPKRLDLPLWHEQSFSKTSTWSTVRKRTSIYICNECDSGFHEVAKDCIINKTYVSNTQNSTDSSFVCGFSDRVSSYLRCKRTIKMQQKIKMDGFNCKRCIPSWSTCSKSSIHMNRHDPSQTY